MTKVLTFGCWDNLHPGQVSFLQRARSLGDHLTVAVASDQVILEDKHQLPMFNLPARMFMLDALACVDQVLPYWELRFLDTMTFASPDVLAIGEQWGGAKRHKEAEETMFHTFGGSVIRLPYTPGVSTSFIRGVTNAGK